jgi:beta-acetyl hexosaminidase like
MLCGGYAKIWPEPTKAFIGTSVNSFHLNEVQYKIKTPFKAVQHLLENAFAVFLSEVRQISHEKTEETEKSSTGSYKDHHSYYTRKHNLTTVNIFLNVLKTSDIHLTLSTDECYNLTMTSESHTLLQIK